MFTLEDSVEKAGGPRRRNSKSAEKPGGERDRMESGFAAYSEYQVNQVSEFLIHHSIMVSSYLGIRRKKRNPPENQAVT